MKKQRDEFKKELTNFFETQLKDKKYVICEECGKKIFNPGRETLAHILPKAIFKSVAHNENNFLWLCLEHHGQFDSSYSKAMKMVCWEKAVKKYQLFKDDVEEYHKFLNYFNNEGNITT